LKSRKQLVEVDRTESSDGIPSSGGEETVLAADGVCCAGAAIVFSGGDVIEDALVVGTERIDGLVEETKRILSGRDTGVVDEGDEASEGGGGARGSRKAVSLAANDDLVVEAEEGDVGIATTALVVLVGRGEGDVGLEVSSEALVWYEGWVKTVENPPPEVITPPVFEEQEISVCPLSGPWVAPTARTLVAVAGKDGLKPHADLLERASKLATPSSPEDDMMVIPRAPSFMASWSNCWSSVGASSFSMEP